MRKNYISKTLGGITIMFSIFLFFAAAKQLTYQNEMITANVTSGTIKSTAQTAEDIKGTTNDFISGKFNIKTDGNVNYSYDKNNSIRFYYKAIQLDVLKDKDVNPTLKLEQEENGKKIWKETKWRWIDHDQGVLYFHFQTDQNGVKEMESDFTGNYRVIIED